MKKYIVEYKKYNWCSLIEGWGGKESGRRAWKGGWWGSSGSTGLSCRWPVILFDTLMFLWKKDVINKLNIFTENIEKLYNINSDIIINYDFRNIN